jgi:hypothetical protein
MKVAVGTAVGGRCIGDIVGLGSRGLAVNVEVGFGVVFVKDAVGTADFVTVAVGVIGDDSTATLVVGFIEPLNILPACVISMNTTRKTISPTTVKIRNRFVRLGFIELINLSMSR